MPITTLLFDLDGTLLETEPGILGCLRHTLQSLGLPDRSDPELRAYIGPPLKQAWDELAGPQQSDRAVELYRQCYDARGKFEAAVYAGIPQALQDLSARHRLVVATSKREVFAREMLAHFGLARFFAAVYGVRPDDLAEPKAGLIGRILRDHALSPDQAVMIGDREFDILGARAHGVRSVGVLWGYGSRDELTTHGADRLCQRPGDLAGLVASF